MNKILKKLVAHDLCIYLPDLQNDMPIQLLGQSNELVAWTRDEDLAKELFAKGIDIECVDADEKLIVTGKFHLAILQSQNEKLLTKTILKVSEYGGIVIAPFDYDEETVDIIINQIFEANAAIEYIFNEDGKKYAVIARRKENEYNLFTKSKDSQLSYYHEPIDIDEVKELKFKRPIVVEKGQINRYGDMPEWKKEVLLKNSTLLESILSPLKQKRFMGSVIKMPNKEQTTVLMTAGRFNSEVLLKDGNLYMLKGTEAIEYEDRLKTDLQGNVKAIRRVAKRKAVLYGLDLTNGHYVKFE